MAKYASAATSQTQTTNTSSTASNPNAVVKLPPVSSIGTQTTTLQPAQQAPQQSVQQPQAVGSGS
jgi:hypothetical protein